jgi:hypothetical protein
MRRFPTIFLLATLCCLASITAAHAVTRTVPGSFATIQAAINASAYGDVVQVGPGTFNENLNLKNGVTLLGSGMGVTIINGRAITYCIFVTGAATSDTKVMDLTVTNGRANLGGGIKIEN